MRSNYKRFNLDSSLTHIDDILNDSNTYDESNDIPYIEDLTFNNGKYVKCAAFFIDLRGSTDLIVAIVNSFKTCKEINIVGDCVSAVFSGEVKESESSVIEALQAASMSNGMMDVLNVKYQKNGARILKKLKLE